MTYNPWQGYDELDEEERRRQARAAAQGMGPEPAQAPDMATGYSSGMVGQGRLSSLLKPANPEMDQRWLSAENTALDASPYGGKGQSYGVGEAVRDFAPMAVAGALDVFLNKGKGLAPIMAVSADEAQKGEKVRREMGQNAAEFAKAARAQRESGNKQGLGLAVEARQQEQFAMMNDPNHPAARAYADKLVAAGVPREFVEGLPLAQLQRNSAAYTPYFRHAAAPLTTEDAAAKQGAVTKARLGAEDEHYPTELDQKAGIAAAETDARQRVTAGYAPQRINEDVERERALGPVRLSNKEAEADAGVGPGSGNAGHMDAASLQRVNSKLDFGDGSVLQQALRTRALTKDVMQQLQAANRAIEDVERLHQTAEDFQEAALNGDVKKAWLLRRQYKSHAEEYAGMMKIVNKSNTEGARTDFLGLVPSLADPTAPEGVQALWSSVEAAVGANLGTLGVRARTPAFMGGGMMQMSGQPQQQAQPQAAPQPMQQPSGVRERAVPEPGQPGYSYGANVDETLPVVPGRPPKVNAVTGGRPTAPAPTGPSSAGNVVMMRDPEGEVGAVPADQVRQAESMGYVRVN